MDRKQLRPYDPLQWTQILHSIRIKRREGEKTGVEAGDIEEKSGECQEDILLFGDRSKEVADLKKYQKML